MKVTLFADEKFPELSKPGRWPGMPRRLGRRLAELSALEAEEEMNDKLLVSRHDERKRTR